MLNSNKACQEVYEKSIFTNAKPKTLTLDCSTISPQLAKDVHKT
jgi:3-hydroxyisobutyrate dehydrogenase-like beta-hydroxyacid dehydrogenase